MTKIQTGLQRLAAVFSLTAVTACTSVPSFTTEAGDFSAQRTPISNLPTDCTIYTREQGVVRNGQVVFNEGAANRNCVASTNARQRNQGTAEAIYDVRRVVNEADALLRTIRRFGKF